MPCLQPPSEIIRRTEQFFENVHVLEELALNFGRIPKDKEGVKDVSGNVLHSLSEFRVRKICSEVIYRAGLQGCVGVSEKKFADNTLHGKMDARGSQIFHPSITLERMNSRKIRTYGECQCTFGAEGNLCPHMAALMIAWVRKPEQFEEDMVYLISKFEKAKQNVIGSAKELVGVMENTSSAEDLFLLQKTYSEIRRWGDAINEVLNKDVVHVREAKNFDPTRELSGTINYVSLAIISAIGRKYPKSQAIETYNKATLTTFGRVLELFVENTRYGSKSSESPITKRERKMPRQKTARSWDILVESFAKGS